MAKRSMALRGGKPVYFLDGEPVSKAAYDAGWHVRPPNYAAGECPTVKPDMDDFSSMNGGRGMWNDQLSAYVKSTQDTIDKGKARGLAPIT